MTLTRAQKRAADRALRAGFEMAGETIRNPDAYPDFLVVIPFDPELLSAVFTPERLRVWTEISRRHPETLTELAGCLGRNVSRVRQDVRLLERAGLAKTTKKGTRVRVTAQGPNILIRGST